MPVVIGSARGNLVAKDESKKLFVTIGESVQSIRGVTIQIKCPAYGQPEPKVVWFVNSTRLNGTTKYTIDANTKSLVISKMSIEYTGVYTCIAEGVKSKSQASSNIVLLRKYASIFLSYHLFILNCVIWILILFLHICM